MTLFDSPSQYREKATLWRVFSLFPLYSSLAQGRIWRWFAINIPMDLGTGGTFTSDIDILARLNDYPNSNSWRYQTWEVKVSLLCKDGTGRSLKKGKTARTITQLKAYRDFGSPDVSLLDIYLCEAGFMGHNQFPPAALHDTVPTKLTELHRERFGYQMLPFEHGRDGDTDFGLLAVRNDDFSFRTMLNFLPASNTGLREPFSRLAETIDKFFEGKGDQPRKSFNQITFCRECRQLQLICMREEHLCPNCRSDLIVQS